MRHTVVAASRVVVEAADPGRLACSPSLWILLGGQYRTFDSTARGFLEAGRRSSACFGVAMMTEVFIDEVDAEKQKWQKPMWRAISKNRDDVASLVEKQANETFGGRLAYAVVRRTGAVTDYPSCLTMWWHGSWAVARWALAVRGLSPRPDSLVIRTRPDVALTDWFDTTNLMRLLSRAVHLVHGQESRGQGDVLWLSDLRTYERDFALPVMMSADLPEPFRGALNQTVPPSVDLARQLWDVANANAWGWGRSILNGVQPFLAPCMDACLCLDGTVGCDPAHASCYVDVLVSETFHTMRIVRQPQAIAIAADQPPIALGTKLVALCAYCTSLHINKSHFALQPEASWLKDNLFYCAKRPKNIGPTDDPVRKLWPPGCGAGPVNSPRHILAAESCRPAYYYFSMHIDEVSARHVSVDERIRGAVRHSPDFYEGSAYVAVNPNFVWRNDMT